MQLGEPAPSAPDYYLSIKSGACSQLDYKQVFMDYFFTAESSNITQALSCISVKIREFRDLINHEFLNKSETVNVLNQDFIQTNNMKPIINNILDPKYFNDYIFMKNSLIQLMNSNFQRGYLSADSVCLADIDGEHIISKAEADILISFLADLSTFFSSVEESAQVVFQDFFKEKSIESLNIQKSNQKLTELSLFLSDRLSEEFPGYSQFLKSQIEEDRKLSSELMKMYDDLSYKLTPKEEELIQEAFSVKTAVAPLLSSLNVSPEGDEKISVQNVKYMMLNIYIMKVFFQVYDLNQDFSLSPQELKSFSCLITPLISVLISPKLEERWKIIQDTYNPRAVSHYIINYQELPPEFNKFGSIWKRNSWRFLWYRVMPNSDKLDKLSYTEVSRLISLLFSEFFNKIQLEEEL